MVSGNYYMEMVVYGIQSDRKLVNLRSLQYLVP